MIRVQNIRSRRVHIRVERELDALGSTVCGVVMHVRRWKLLPFKRRVTCKVCRRAMVVHAGPMPT